MRELLAEIYRRDKVLALVGWYHLGLVAVLLLIAPFDSRTVLGLNPWIKPIKFLVSTTIYLWTLAWFLKYLTGPRWAIRAISWGASFVMFVEIICIMLQAARGTTSHFNIKSAFDSSIFSIMGSLIFVNTLLATLALVLFFARTVELSRAYLWGIRLGFLLFILGSLVGVAMVTNHAHTVGLADGGPGLPFVNWSTKAGDLRIAHMLGLHSLQILPLAGYALSSGRRNVTQNRQVAGLLIFALIYTAVGVLLFWQAMSGRPLIALG